MGARRARRLAQRFARAESAAQADGPACARGLGVTARVPSPTFALVNEYRGGRLPLWHLDLYRLATRAEIVAAGLEPYLCRPPGVVVVEWIERWMDQEPGPLAPGVRFRRVEIKTAGEAERRIVYEDFGG